MKVYRIASHLVKKKKKKNLDTKLTVSILFFHEIGKMIMEYQDIKDGM